ncbi:threonine synthase-like 2 [Gracilinanus agilis]|uniref:threonine synthase-like 2 n=1 Tax=Gracilinanus agilis TaxID=191870 RepID=UPI001CFC9E21|nr:threonine synthase-like 2 [Gracilinanus agilis]
MWLPRDADFRTPRKQIVDIVATLVLAGCLIDRAFSRFRHRDVVHLSRLKNGLNVLELWHGITYAFKDLSLSCSGQFLQYFLEKRQKHVTIIVGTSGDTGSSAIESVRGAKNIDIIVLLPLGLCSKIQELQMTTVIEDNVHVFRVEGNSDELDEPIKAVFADVAFAKKHNLMSLNSINWSRILVQMAHYFFAYFQCVPSMDICPLPPVEVVVPTGAAGNLAAGCIAQEMGLPVRLATVVNRNDIIHRTVRQGDFSLSGNTRASLASAMDIQGTGGWLPKFGDGAALAHLSRPDAKEADKAPAAICFFMGPFLPGFLLPYAEQRYSLFVQLPIVTDPGGVKRSLKWACRTPIVGGSWVAKRIET